MLAVRILIRAAVLLGVLAAMGCAAGAHPRMFCHPATAVAASGAEVEGLLCHPVPDAAPEVDGGAPARPVAPSA